MGGVKFLERGRGLAENRGDGGVFGWVPAIGGCVSQNVTKGFGRVDHRTVGRLRELRRENRELRRANEMLRKPSAYFSQADAWTAYRADEQSLRMNTVGPNGVESLLRFPRLGGLFWLVSMPPVGVGGGGLRDCGSCCGSVSFQGFTSPPRIHSPSGNPPPRHHLGSDALRPGCWSGV